MVVKAGAMSTPPDPTHHSRRRHQRGQSGGILSWLWVILGVGCGILLVVLGIRDRHGSDVAVGLGLIGVCVLLSRPSRQAIARRLVANRPKPDLDGAVVVYWRSDDLNCQRMRSALRDIRDQIVWINLFWDGEAENFARQQSRGEEILPVVRWDGEVFVAPSPEMVRAAVAGELE